MANFNIAFALTNNHEGGYADNPKDTGGETYMGISRNNWPSWGGWHYIDAIKSGHGKTASTINKFAGSDQNVQALVKQFYQVNFWAKLHLGDVNDQQVANNAYDFGVNAGTGTAAKSLQRAVNSVCGNLTVDGQVGNATIAAVNKLNGKSLYDAFNEQRKVFYNNIVKNNPSQKEFLAGWIKRASVPYTV